MSVLMITEIFLDGIFQIPSLNIFNLLPLKPQVEGPLLLQVFDNVRFILGKVNDYARESLFVEVLC